MNNGEFALLELAIYIEETYIKDMTENLADPNTSRASQAKCRYEIAESKKKLKELNKQRKQAIDSFEVKP